MVCVTQAQLMLRVYCWRLKKQISSDRTSSLKEPQVSEGSWGTEVSIAEKNTVMARYRVRCLVAKYDFDRRIKQTLPPLSLQCERRPIIWRRPLLVLHERYLGSS